MLEKNNQFIEVNNLKNSELSVFIKSFFFETKEIKVHVSEILPLLPKEQIEAINDLENTTNYGFGVNSLKEDNSERDKENFKFRVIETLLEHIYKTLSLEVVLDSENRMYYSFDNLREKNKYYPEK